MLVIYLVRYNVNFFSISLNNEFKILEKEKEDREIATHIQIGEWEGRKEGEKERREKEERGREREREKVGRVFEPD